MVCGIHFIAATPKQIVQCLSAFNILYAFATTDEHTIAGRQNARKTASQITSIHQSNRPSSVHVSNEKKANATGQLSKKCLYFTD